MNRSNRLTFVFAILICTVASLVPWPAQADEQCGDGWYGQQDPRVPLTLCTPWPKPTWEEWQRGWRFMRPSQPMETMPLALEPSNATSSGYAVTICYLGDLATLTPNHEANRCLGVAADSIPLSYWCERLRQLETPSVKVPWFEMDGVCGSTFGLTTYSEAYRRGKMTRLVQTK